MWKSVGYATAKLRNAKTCARAHPLAMQIKTARASHTSKQARRNVVVVCKRKRETVLTQHAGRTQEHVNTGPWLASLEGARPYL